MVKLRAHPQQSDSFFYKQLFQPPEQRQLLVGQKIHSIFTGNDVLASISLHISIKMMHLHHLDAQIVCLGSPSAVNQST